MATPPVFSVIIATYNWSSALRLALRSVLGQTFGDFEVLVVGDGCTDDSADVVRSMGDPRVQWHNLPRNHGSQWAPNNHGLSQARGKYVAYLGHDDLWWPTHLAQAFDVLEHGGADIAAAATLMYGPEDSGIRALSGFFPNDRFSLRHFFVPSSMAHRLEIARAVGGWRPPEEAILAVDVDFLRRCHDAGARVVATKDVTTFKFNAAWRRDAYLTKDPHQQREFMEQAARLGEAFRLRELTRALEAASQDKLIKIEVPTDAKASATISSNINHQFKGSRKTQRLQAFTLVQGRRRYPPNPDYAGFEWHGLENDRKRGAFRWSGPCTQSHIVLPERMAGPSELRLQLVHHISTDVLRSLRVTANDVTVDMVMTPQEDGTLILHGCIPADAGQQPDSNELRLALTVSRTWRPIDLRHSDDRRWLGVAVGWTEIGPWPPEPSQPKPSRGTWWKFLRSAE